MKQFLASVLVKLWQYTGGSGDYEGNLDPKFKKLKTSQSSKNLFANEKLWIKLLRKAIITKIKDFCEITS